MACPTCASHAMLNPPGLGSLFSRDGEGQIVMGGLRLEELAALATVTLAAITLWQVMRRV